MKKILILGSNSFAGATFIKYISGKDHLKIFAISRSKENDYYRLPYKWISKGNFVTFKKFDINKNYNEIIKYLNKIKPNYIVDFAAQGMVNQSWQNPEHWYYTNVYSKAKLHNYLCKSGYIEKYLKISTAEVYGNSSTKIIERAHYNPSTPYALSHATMDMNLKLLHDNFKFPVVFARPLNFYGPGQQIFRIIPKTIYAILKKKKLFLEGDGSAIRSFVYSDDFSDAMYKSLIKGRKGEIYHIASDEYISIKSLVNKICIKLSTNFNDIVVSVPARINQDQNYFLNTQKIKKKLKWFPKVSLTKGLDNTISWLSRNINKVRNSDLIYIHKK
jgi:dTDP-glucose 4,6-dehydratase|tara:strand:+ start:122 stop:1114 length:993 start_codon:yes stop_codon:yes gene_type:complete